MFAYLRKNDDFYEDLFKQEEIMCKVRSFFQDLYNARMTNPNYKEITDEMQPNYWVAVYRETNNHGWIVKMS